MLVGEIGSKFEDPRDLQSLRDMAAWFQAKPNTGAPHSPVMVSSNMETPEAVGLKRRSS